jgi:type IV pilus assembly protein PilQ
MKAKEKKIGSGVELRRIVLVVLAVSLTGGMMASGQDTPAGAIPAQNTNVSLVTINVDNGPITQVLNAFSRQTGRNIVIGSEVAGNVTLRVTDKPWNDALDVILKPYGFDYYMVGDTIIICGKDKLPKDVVLNKTASGSAPVAPSPKAEDPLEVKVFTLKYLDASDVAELVQSQLTPNRGKIGKLLARSQSWKEQSATSGGQNTSSESLGRLQRVQEESVQVRGKTLVIVDTREVIKAVAAMLDKIDRMPSQIQIEAKFVEVSANLLRDIGVEWGTGSDGGGAMLGTSGAGSLYAAGARQSSSGVKPDSFKPQSSSLSGTSPFNSGLSLAFQKLTDLQFSVLLHLLEEDASYKMLSAPKVMTMDNQDAVILVGQKLPIISSTIGAGDTPGTTKTTTTLERYEDIGIKLKVLPQVCEDNNINLIVHPSVRELLGYQSGNASAGSEISGAAYPIIAAREAETQVLVKSGQTIVIGGMIREKKQNTQIKVPFLGSIPLIGVLFRRDTVNTEKIELLIFLTATIRDSTEGLSVKSEVTAPLIKVEKADVVSVPVKP